MRETKPFYTTSEWWLSVAVIAGVLFGGEFFPVPDNLEGIAAGVIAAAYAISRGLAKLGVPADEEVVDPEVDPASLDLEEGEEVEVDPDEVIENGAPPPSEARPRKAAKRRKRAG